MAIFGNSNVNNPKPIPMLQTPPIVQTCIEAKPKTKAITDNIDPFSVFFNKTLSFALCIIHTNTIANTNIKTKDNNK